MTPSAQASPEIRQAAPSAREEPNRSTDYLVRVIQELSLARDLETIMAVVRRAARALTGADGATFILRDGDQCYYADEDAIAPLWKGRRFPMTACISGWAMLHRESVAIADIYTDARIPHDAYRPTFVKSLAMVPVRTLDPIGAIGNYWAEPREPREEELRVLQALADTTAVAMENVQVYAELAQRVKDRTAALEAANKELESFSYSVSHDLRAPVRAISGFSRLIAELHRDEVGDEVRRKLGIIESEANRLSGLIDGLLEFSRSGTHALKPNMLDMTALAKAVFTRLRANEPNAAATDLRLAALPKCWGDAKLVEQLWTNVLSNAVKFSSKRDDPRIEVTGTSDGTHCTYAVRDNGVGFDAKYAGKLFDVFQRLHHESEFPGTGVGLALVHRIVTRHGGRIWGDSVLGEGATFHFTLPASEHSGDCASDE